jgi:hypothetical protein
MEMSIGATLLGFSTLLCVGTTLGAFAKPVEFAEYLGLNVANAGGVNEIRSQYAGFFLMVGLAFAAALGGWLPRVAGYFLAFVVFGGLFVGRVSSVLLNRGMKGYPPVVCGLVLIDFVGCAMSAAALNLAGATLS